MTNYMDNFLSYLESTTPEERLGRKPETAEAVEHPADLVVLCESCHDLFHANGKLVRAPSPIPSTTGDPQHDY